MSLDITPDQNAIADYIKAQSTPAYSYIPDDVAVTVNSDGKIRPFLVYTFGSLTGAVSGLTWMGEEYQPQQTFLILTSYAADPDTARSVANYNSKRLIGWRPNSNCTFMVAGTGRGYQIDIQDKPTRYIQEQIFRFSVNMADQSV